MLKRKYQVKYKMKSKKIYMDNQVIRSCFSPVSLSWNITNDIKVILMFTW